MRQKSTSLYAEADDAKCREAVETLHAAEISEFEAEVGKRRDANPLTRHLPRAPAKASDALPRTLYWNVDGKTKYVPYRAVVVGGGVQYERACQHDGCAQVAHANPAKPEEGATHCKQHGGGKRCPGPDGKNDDGECPFGFCVQIGKQDAYDGQCVRCFCASNPNDERARTALKCIHVREQTTVAEVKKSFPNFTWTLDKPLGLHRSFLRGVNTRFRPDARTTVGNIVILIEIDEDSHRRYLCAKEREREESLVLQLRGKTPVMIRFNPDRYEDINGNKHASCFSAPSKVEGTTHVPKKQQKQWKERIATLIDTIRYLSDPDEELPPKQDERAMLTIELFYDNIAKTPEEERIAAGKKAARAMGKRKRFTD